MEKKLIIKETLNIRLILYCFVFVYLFLVNLTYANENFIVTTVNKLPISKIDVINKAKILLYSKEKTTGSNNLNKYYNQAIKDLINERVVFSEGVKINQKIENLVTPKAESLLLANFNNSESQLNNFLKSLSIPKSALLEKYNVESISLKYANNLKQKSKNILKRFKNRPSYLLGELLDTSINRKN